MVISRTKTIRRQIRIPKPPIHTRTLMYFVDNCIIMVLSNLILHCLEIICLKWNSIVLHNEPFGDWYIFSNVQINSKKPRLEVHILNVDYGTKKAIYTRGDQ